MCIAFSGIFYRWAEVTPSTGTVFRALFGLPLLALVAYAEQRRYGPLPTRLVAQSEDVLVDARGYIYLTEKNQGLWILQYNGPR